MTCQELDHLITPFVDDLCTDAERAAIVAHLRTCASCSARVESESTAKHVLHAHASVARTMGVPPAWRPRVFRLGQPMVAVPPVALLLLAITGAAAGGAWWLRSESSSIAGLPDSSPLIAVGYISDSHCQQDHSRLMIRGERECTLGCVQAGAEFVLVTGTELLRIRNQQLPQLAEFANRRVSVEGSLENGGVLIERMTAADSGD